MKNYYLILKYICIKMYQRKPNSNRNVVKNYSQDPSYNGRRGTVQLLNNNTNKDEFSSSKSKCKTNKF